VEELSTLRPEAGEEAALAARRQTMMQSEKVASEINDALETVGGHGSPIPALSSVQRRLERRGAQAPELIEPSVKALEIALNALEEARTALEAAQRAANFDPHELERIEERLFALRAAARKYSVLADDLAALRDRFAADVAAIDAGESSLAKLEAAMVEADRQYCQAAQAVSVQRYELPPLKLERAKFIVSMERDDDARGPDGFDRVEFWVQTNPGTRAGPMMKVASGGELSRFMLALKVCLADRGSAPTLVFDEIDTGVGGAVADAIGQRLARLAHGVQVLSVTHAPQVAARAGRHFLIAKEGTPEGDRVATRIVAISDANRRDEIARMLSGAEITDEARAAATRLIEAAR
jgi:DNA repair protein RecN (Recombination protein N)